LRFVNTARSDLDAGRLIDIALIILMRVFVLRRKFRKTNDMDQCIFKPGAVNHSG
jgi:hypothetical protein